MLLARGTADDVCVLCLELGTTNVLISIANAITIPSITVGM